MSRRNPRRLPHESWLKTFRPEQRRVMRKFGIPPDRDPRAAMFNAKVLTLAEGGMRGLGLAIAAAKLHEQVFSDVLTRAAIAEHFQELVELNRAGDIEQLAFVVLNPVGEMTAGLVGKFDSPYVMRSIESVADVLDAASPDSRSAGLVSEPPPPSQLTAEQLAVNEARVEAFLLDLADANKHGDIAGTGAIVFSRHPALYRFVGSVPPREFARVLRKLRQQIKRGHRVPQRDAAH